jgi:hypothetical protein
MNDEEMPAETAQQVPAAEEASKSEGHSVVRDAGAGDADRSGAEVVAAVGDETGMEAVAAVETDTFDTVLAAEFASPQAARIAYSALLDAELQGRLHIDGVLAVHADSGGKIHIDTMTEHSTRTGVKWGAAGGLVLGILFPPSIIASTVAWGIVGGALGKLRNMHHRDLVADRLAGAIGPDHSGIIALIHAAETPQVRQHIPEATRVTTAEVDSQAARDIAEEARKAKGASPAG